MRCVCGGGSYASDGLRNDPAVKEEARNHSGDREHYELTALMNGMQYVDSIVGVVRQRVY